MENCRSSMDDVYLPYAKHRCRTRWHWWDRARCSGTAGSCFVSALGAWCASVDRSASSPGGSRSGADVATLWMLGLGSPMIFDASGGDGHGLGGGGAGRPIWCTGLCCGRFGPMADARWAGGLAAVAALSASTRAAAHRGICWPSDRSGDAGRALAERSMRVGRGP